MDALTALRAKRDTRSYLPDPIDDATLEQVLDAARMAGSAKNRQPVRMVVVTDLETRTALRDAGDFASWIHEAPVVVVVTVRNDVGPRGMFDVGRHAQNLMVAAQASGLASCPVTIHHPDVARRILAIPDDIDPVMIVTLGRPGERDRRNPVAGPRIALEDYAPRGRWTSDA